MDALSDRAHVGLLAGSGTAGEGLERRVVVQGAVAQVALLKVEGGLGGVRHSKTRVSLQHRVNLLEDTPLQAQGHAHRQVVPGCGLLVGRHLLACRVQSQKRILRAN